MGAAEVDRDTGVTPGSGSTTGAGLSAGTQPSTSTGAAATGAAQVAEILREHGHRVTRARLAVWRALTGSSGHATVDELAGAAQELEPGVNLASVYRSLTLFAELELARESRLGDEDATRWEVAHPDEHFHLVCDRCGRVDHHVGELVAGIAQHLEEGHGFAPRSVELIVSGVCRSCREADGQDAR